jgi:hypothetical protein
MDQNPFFWKPLIKTYLAQKKTQQIPVPGMLNMVSSVACFEIAPENLSIRGTEGETRSFASSEGAAMHAVKR